jgi:hypothetical protein
MIFVDMDTPTCHVFIGQLDENNTGGLILLFERRYLLTHIKYYYMIFVSFLFFIFVSRTMKKYCIL